MFFEIYDSSYEDLPFLLTTVGMQDHQPKISRPKGHGYFHHLLYVIRGEGRFTLGDEQFILHDHQGLFFHMNTPCQYEAVGSEFSTGWFTFRGTGVQLLLDYYHMGDYRVFTVTDKMIESLISFEKGAHKKNVIGRSADGYAFLLKILDYINLPPTPWGQKVLRINQFLESHFSEQFSLDDVAHHIGTNRYTLCKQYKQLTGTTVVSHLLKIRISKAKEMLPGSHLRTQEIAQLCGFESPSYFGKIFKEQVGMTPGEYRDAMLL